MKLSEEQKRRLVQRLEEVWTCSDECAICGGTNWTLSERLFELRAHPGGPPAMDAGMSAPLVLVTCADCGHTLLFNAVAMGLKPR